MPDFEDKIPISEFSYTNTLHNTDQAPIIQQDGADWDNFRTSMADIGLHINKEMEYVTDLHTTSKKIIGAINELADGVSSMDITTEINTPAPIQTFTDGGDNIPMKSCEVAINNQSGISSVTISVRGQNFIDMSTLAMRDVASDHTQRAGYAPVTLPAGTYKLFLVFSGTARTIYAQNAVTFDSIASGNSDFTFTLTETTSVLIRTTFMSVETAEAAITSISMFDTGTITDTTVSLGQTVYEGSADVVNGTGISGGVPFTFTGANIPTLSGVNNVYADCGDINALEYFNDKADNIASMVRLMTRS